MLSWWWSNVQHYGQWSMTYTTRFICQQQVKICIGRFQDNGTQIGAEAKLQIVLNGDYLVALQSTVGPERCIGVNEDGSLKSAQNCSSSNVSFLFGVLLIVRINVFKAFFFRDKTLEIFLSSFVFIYFFVTDSN